MPELPQMRPAAPDTWETQIWKFMGYSDDDILKMLNRRQEVKDTIARQQEGGEFLLGGNYGTKGSVGLTPIPGHEEATNIEKGIEIFDAGVNALGGFAGVSPLTGQRGSLTRELSSQMSRGRPRIPNIASPQTPQEKALSLKRAQERALREGVGFEPVPEPMADVDYIATPERISARDAQEALRREAAAKPADTLGRHLTDQAIKASSPKAGTGDPYDMYEVSRPRVERELTETTNQPAGTGTKEFGQVSPGHYSNIETGRVGNIKLEALRRIKARAAELFQDPGIVSEVTAKINPAVQGQFDLKTQQIDIPYDAPPTTLSHEVAHRYADHAFPGEAIDPLPPKQGIPQWEHRAYQETGGGKVAEVDPYLLEHTQGNIDRRAAYSPEEHRFQTYRDALENDPIVQEILRQTKENTERVWENPSPQPTKQSGLISGKSADKPWEVFNPRAEPGEFYARYATEAEAKKVAEDLGWDYDRNSYSDAPELPLQFPPASSLMKQKDLDKPTVERMRGRQQEIPRSRSDAAKEREALKTSVSNLTEALRVGDPDLAFAAGRDAGRQGLRKLERDNPASGRADELIALALKNSKANPVEPAKNQAAVDEAHRAAYEGAPDSLMGFRKQGPQREYGESKYKFELPVVVDFKDGTPVHEDVIKGLNRAHALERARRNWPGAEVKAR